MIRGILLLTFLVFAYNSFADLKTETRHRWKKVKHIDGIDIYEAEVQGADVVAFRGDTTLNFPIARVVSSLADMKRKDEWMHDLKEVKTVEIIDPHVRIEYYHSGTPWPLDDRDFVYRAEFRYFPKKETFVLNLVNAKHKKVPEKENVVRGKIFESNYFISKTSNPNVTKISVEILVDPMGNIPKWIVNIFQKDWPHKTLTGLKRLMGDSSFKTNKRVAKYIKDNILILEKGE